MSIHYCISEEIFQKFPAYLRGVVVARNIHNGASPQALIDSLREAETELGARLAPDSVVSHPHIASWREAYRSAGIKPADFRPSVEALIRRVVKKDPLPTINTVVDLGNLISIQHLIPIGAHAIDVVKRDLSLRCASGLETFEPFGADITEHPAPGEIIFTEDDIVLTRRWTWRQAKHTLILPDTTDLEFNIDGLPPVSYEEVKVICEQTASLIQKYCGGSACWFILSQDNPEISF